MKKMIDWNERKKKRNYDYDNFDRTYPEELNGSAVGEVSCGPQKTLSEKWKHASENVLFYLSVLTVQKFQALSTLAIKDNQNVFPMNSESTSSNPFQTRLLHEDIRVSQSSTVHIFVSNIAAFSDPKLCLGRSKFYGSQINCAEIARNIISA